MTFIIEQLLLNELMFTGCPRNPNENKNLPHKTERKEERREGGVGICVCWSYHCNVLEE